jgi:Protein of unknown function (DUF2652)/Polyketide cyclase / dehydrase and lipid transport
MSETPQTGFLVVADLTGYTAYLSRSELEHAPAIAGDLLETIVGRLDPPFRLAKFEGDGAFMWVEDGRADASLLLDAVEASYLAFRRRLRSIDQATSCECNSCRLAPRLDLKLFIHHGSYVRTQIAGRDELAGSDVIVVHRLLKGTGAAAGRGNGFALFTAQAVAAMGLDATALELVEAKESIEHLGQVSTFTLDLEARWQAESGARRLDVGDSELILDIDSTVAAEPAVVWAHLTSPALRTRWEGPMTMIDETLTGGRRGVGTLAQCVTGKLATLEEIVDWQPYDHVGWRLAVPGVGPVAAVVDLDAVEGGTRMRVRWDYQGAPPLARAAIAEVRAEREAAFARLANAVAGALPVVEQREVAS